jgi:MFS family permease
MGTDESFWSLLPAMILGGIGMALAMAPVTAAAMGSVPRDKAGVGSAVLNSMRQVGGSLGIAIMGAIVAASVSGSAVGGQANPSDFVAGFHHALEVGAVLVIVGAVVAATTLKRTRHSDEVPEAHLVEAAS